MRNQLFIVMLRSTAHLLFRNCSHFYKLIRCELTFPIYLVKIRAEISTKHCLFIIYIPSVYHIYRLFIICIVYTVFSIVPKPKPPCYTSLRMHLLCFEAEYNLSKRKEKSSPNAARPFPSRVP